MGKEVNVLGSHNFKKEIESGVTLVDFYADWCTPCKMLAPTVAKIAEEFDGKIKVGKINIDEANDIAAEYNVMSIPTVIAFKDGKMVDKSIGLVSQGKLKDMMNKII